MTPLTPHHPPPPAPRVRRALVGAVIVLVLAMVGGILWLQSLSWRGAPAPVVEEGPPPVLKLPDMLSRAAKTYAEQAAQRAREAIPVAVPVPKPAAAAVPPAEPAPVIQESILPPMPWTAPPTPTPAATPVPAGEPAPGTGTPPTKPKPPKWDYQARGKTTPEKPLDPAAKEELAKVGKAQALIQPATWAIPAYPLVTIYRSQTLIGRLLQAVNSDIPGQVKLELTLPLFDKFGRDHLILDKGTIIIASQDGGKPQYGASRLALKLEQLELPTGEIVSLKATIGDDEGANGMAAKVNGHYGKLLLATGLSAILNIGVRQAAGTPSGYYPSPGQEAARDIGTSVQHDAQSVVDRELRVPPTLTIAAGTPCTVNLGENVQFNKKPLVVR